jgi:hypothetical protein
MARIEHKDVGDVWEPQATFTVGGTPTDPTNITAKYREPDGTIITFGPVAGGTGGSGITRVSAGIFKFTTPIVLDAAGYWKARFEGTGAAAAAEDHELIVDPSEFVDNAGLSTRALVGLAETKDWLQGQNVDTGEDLELVALINDISDLFHDEAEREFKVSETNPQTRTFAVEHMASPDYWYIDGDYMGDRSTLSRRISVGDLVAAPTTVTIVDTDWTTTLETVSAGNMTMHPTVRESWEPITEIEFQNTVTSLRPGMRVNVTGNFGFPSVPGRVRRAVLEAIETATWRTTARISVRLRPAKARM